jgi:DeoR/GlpR family transcriptional regulator of sugar metabolism
MQVFLSHSSRQKPLVREVKRNLPEYLNLWIDEQKLLFGDNIPVSLEATIKSDTDYVLVFIDQYAMASTWVANELKWALEAERIHNRTILLPIVIDEDAFQRLANVELRNRKYLSLEDYSEASIRALSDAITSELFALVARDLQNLRTAKPKAASSAISSADALIHANAALIQEAVFPHRRTNPISVQALRGAVNSKSAGQLSSDEFESILSTVIHRNLVPGLYFDGFELYLVEEHSLWKSEVHHAKKERIGRKVSTLIKNDMKIFLDAGSTTREIASIISKKIETHVLTKLTLATTSIHIANVISQCCVTMGFDDTFSAVQLLVPGGRVRPATQAIVSVDVDHSQILRLADFVGGFDMGVIGVNGVDSDGGFTTHDNAEVLNKVDIMRVSRTRLLAGDSSKIGIVLEEKFAVFSDDIQFVVDDDPNNAKLRTLLECHKDKIILA